MSKYKTIQLPTKRIKDLTGITIGFTGYVKGLVKLDIHRNTHWLCVCDCGCEFVCRGDRIRRKLVKRCPRCSYDLKNKDKIRDLIGYKFDNNTEVIKFVEVKNRKSYWLLKCGICGDVFKDTNENIVCHKSAKSCHKCRHKKIDLTGRKFGYNCQVLCEIDKLPNSNGRRWQCKCHCGKIWDVSQTHIVANRIKECKKCSTKRCSKWFRGKNHPCYNHDLTDEERNDNRHHVQVWRWKDIVLKRDKRTCQVTGSKKNLVVHHLDGWNWAKDKRLDVDNGITISQDAHDEFHDIYGRGDNTMEQFFQFIVQNY